MVNYVCPRCHQIFYKKSTFDYHVNKRKRSCLDQAAILKKKEIIQQPVKSDIFTCDNCDKTFTRKDSLQRHVSQYCKPSYKKEKVEKKEEDDDVELEEYDKIVKYEDDDSHVAQRLPGRIYSKPAELSTKLFQVDVNTFQCPFCSKIYRYNYNLNKHIKICPFKTKEYDEKEKIFHLLVKQMDVHKKEVDKLRQQTDEQNQMLEKIMRENRQLRNTVQNGDYYVQKNTQNITNNFNIQNNNMIELVAFGNEDLSYISTQTCTNILQKGFQSVPHLIKHVHFNRDKPEHHNVYIPNMRGNYAMIFDGEQWSLKDKKQVIDQLYNDKEDFLVEKYKELERTLNEQTQRKFKRFMESSNDEEVKSLKKDIKLILYNKRHIPIDTKKKVVEPKRIEYKKIF